MIPQTILDYLERNEVNFQRREHLRAITAQALAATLHVSGFRVAKSVILKCSDGSLCIAVCGAPDTVDMEQLADQLGMDHVRLAEESEFSDRFPDCELGAEPPFGKLYGMQVIIDESLRDAGPLLFRAGSHEEAIEMSFQEFAELESPRVGSFIEQRMGMPSAAAEAQPQA
ncbi:YbaK/EbsC family protein [Myxococcaceae bacterium GXIMD 01537]